MKRNYTAILRLIGFNFPLNLVVFNPETSSCIKHVKWSKRGADVSELRPHQMSGNLIIGGYWVTGRWLNSIRWRVAGEFFHRKKVHCTPFHAAFVIRNTTSVLLPAGQTADSGYPQDAAADFVAQIVSTEKVKSSCSMRMKKKQRRI